MSVQLDSKTVRIFAYSSTPRFTDFFTDFEKKTDCFAVYGTVYHAVQATIKQAEQVLFFWFSGQTNCEAGVEREIPSPVGHACLALLARFALSCSLA